MKKRVGSRKLYASVLPMIFKFAFEILQHDAEVFSVERDFTGSRITT